jgi:hypothetical protein
MSQTLEEKRIAELTERIEDFLCEGEEFLIRCQDGQTEVLAGPEINPVRRNHEELYGFLLSLNQQLSEAANLPRWIVRILFLGLILGLHQDWFSGLPWPIDFAKLQSWWVYGLVFLLGFAINSLIQEWAQHRIYAHRRSEFSRLLNESGLPKYRLLTQIEGDPSLPAVSQMLKKDHAQEARF